MNTITSRANQKIKHLHRLHQTKNRALHKQFIAEGLRTCTTLLKGPCTLLDLFVTETMLAQVQDLVPAERITIIPDHVMQKISSAKTPSGILCLFAMPQEPVENQLQPGLVLAELSDPGNVGTLLRTAAAMNVQSVVIINGVDVWHPKVIHASAGTIGQLKIFNWSWEQLLQNKKNLDLYALVVTNGASPNTINPRNALLVVGNEATGIPTAWHADCKYSITLPMPGNTESLNAAVAGSIALYHTFNA